MRVTQREVTLTQLTAARASGAVVLIRLLTSLATLPMIVDMPGALLLVVGAGGYSLDARMNPDRVAPVVT
jgi:hypothetical protein